MNNVDLIYLCTNISNIVGIPVRIYKGNTQIFYYSQVPLYKDPFVLYEENAFKSNRHIEYFTTPLFNYYGIVNFENNKIVIGPTRQLHIAEQDLKQLAFEIGVPHDETDAFITSIKSINKMPLLKLLQLLCLINHVLNSGEKLSLENLTILEIDQSTLKELLEKEEATRTINKADEDEDMSKMIHNTLSIEQMILNIVRKGDLSALKDFISKAPAIQSGTIAKDQLRQAKNTFIVTATLVSRAAISGGLDIEDSLSLSDSYIQKCEMTTSIESIHNLQYRMVIDYTERVEKIKHGKNPSKLVIDVNNYIRHHLSDYITVEKIGESLYMSRSRLSTEFKKETGIDLSVFITTQKIEEAKRLLRYSNKSFSEIAYYLGFSSQSHFTKVFKKYVNLTPNAYRSSNY